MLIHKREREKIFNLKVPKTFKLVYIHGKEISLFANKKFKKSNKVRPFIGKLVPAAKHNAEAIQFSKNLFYDTDYLVLEDFINHSCDPNTFIDLNKKYFIALRDINKDEELTFNYNTTEYDMAKYGEDFICKCGAKKCYKRIRGFKYLSFKEKLALKDQLSPFLLERLMESKT